MRYTLVIDGLEFPGQQAPEGTKPGDLVDEDSTIRQWVTEGRLTYVRGGEPECATLIHWGRARTVQVIAEDF